MDESQQFFLETLKVIPIKESTILLVQAPYEELLSIFEKISFKNDGIYQHIVLNKENIKSLLYEIIYNEFSGYIQSLEILVDGRKIFEGYDGMEYGEFSKNFKLPEDFEKRYIEKDMCLFSDEW